MSVHARLERMTARQLHLDPLSANGVGHDRPIEDLTSRIDRG